jgi:hypothetical protein
LSCLLWGWGHGGPDNPNFPLGWQPMYPGLLVAALIYGAGLLVQTIRPTPFPETQMESQTTASSL